jgi:hypothetical protein
MTHATGRRPSDTQVFSGAAGSPDHGRNARPRFDSQKRDDPQVLTIAPDIKADNQTRTAADPLPDVLRNALFKIRADGAY